MSDYPECPWGEERPACEHPHVLAPLGVSVADCRGCYFREQWEAGGKGPPTVTARPEKPRVQIAELAAARRH
jgi:hypothetical protein